MTPGELCNWPAAGTGSSLSGQFEDVGHHGSDPIKYGVQRSLTHEGRSGDHFVCLVHMDLVGGRGLREANHGHKCDPHTQDKGDPHKSDPASRTRAPPYLGQR